MTNPIKDQVSSMILSASGWRQVFAVSGNEEDHTTQIGEINTLISALIGKAFSSYIIPIVGKNSTIVVGIDARPTGPEIAKAVIASLLDQGIKVQYLGITAAPEIMAYARQVEGFVYISASHNPIGHNGIKFGFNDGGVIPGSEAAKLIAIFKDICNDDNSVKIAENIIKAHSSEVTSVISQTTQYKEKAVKAYLDFTKEVVSGKTDKEGQNQFFSDLTQSLKANPVGIVCDMNGSARCLSIDNTFLPEIGFGFDAINNEAGKIVHAIIPEPENLVHCAAFMEKLHKEGKKHFVLGYMPDCDGDRGNIVYWNDRTQKADVLQAQEVFALSVLSELAYQVYASHNPENLKLGVSVNDPTSMRIEEIAKAFNCIVARAEVGEANVVNRARELRSEGYTVPILGEGSNGGNITHPAAVRDPINTIFALIKLLVLDDTDNKMGLFHLWCKKSGQEHLYKRNFTLCDIIDSLPVYTTTGVSEKRALLHIQTKDHSLLKGRFQKYFSNHWDTQKNYWEKYGISSWEGICNNGTKETGNLTDFSLSGKGGLKILFKNSKNEPVAYMWMRGSGTEPVFRILCDVKGNNSEFEASLLALETQLLSLSDTEN
jgi:phosphoglucomutase